MNTDTHMSGSTVKNYISLKMVFEYSVIRKTSYQSWFLVYHRVLPQSRLLQYGRNLQRKWIIQITLQQSCQAKVWIDKYGETRIQGRITIQQLCQVNMWKGKNGETRALLKLQKSCRLNQPKSKNQIKMRITNRYGETRIIPTYRNGCKNSENLVGDRVPESRHSHVSSSHGLSLEPMRSVDLGKHSVHTHFPKDRNCEICKRTKITRAPCRRLI